MKALVERLMNDDCTGMAAETAYSFIFSFFPFLLLAATSASFFGHGQRTVETVSDALRRFMPVESHALIKTYVEGLFLKGPDTGLFSISLALLLWTASSLIATLMKSLNRAYHTDPKELRPFWKDRLIAVGLVLVTFVPILMASMIAVLGNYIAAFVGRQSGIDMADSYLWGIIEWLLFVVVVSLISALIYYFWPQQKTTNPEGASRSDSFGTYVVRHYFWI